MAPPISFGLGLSLARAGGAALDADAAAYIAAVETADGQALEPAIRTAYNNFIRGCKADGIWDAIKASCILAGARSLSGALVPLKGSAPTNNNFVSGDYVRTTGLVGDGSTKYLDSNRANNADPQDSNHNAVWVSTLGTGLAIASAVTATGANQIGLSGRKNRNLAALLGISMQTGLCGISRSNSADFNYRVGGADNLSTQVSQTTSANNVAILGDADAGYGNHRLAFYSIGESLDLAALDTRVSTLMEQIFKGIYGIDFDDDAYAYITEIRSSGASVDSTQINAINTFVKTGKSDGWYSSLKRLYLPIWASAAPNAVDMVTRVSGTFNGTVTHSAGFAQGDGSTGYFDFGVSPSTLGLTASSESAFALVKTLSTAAAANNYLLGSFDTVSQALVLSGQWRGIINTATGVGNISDAAANPTGIVMLDRAGGDRGIYIRRTAGLTTVVETTSVDAGTIPTSNMHAWSMNILGSPNVTRNDELGAYGISMGLGSTNRSQFSLALKNLYEATTGLTLP